MIMHDSIIITATRDEVSTTRVRNTLVRKASTTQRSRGYRSADLNGKGNEHRAEILSSRSDPITDKYTGQVLPNVTFAGQSLYQIWKDAVSNDCASMIEVSA